MSPLLPRSVGIMLGVGVAVLTFSPAAAAAASASSELLSKSQGNSSAPLDDDSESSTSDAPIVTIFSSCSGTMNEITDCNNGQCAEECTDCIWTAWSEWSSCMCEGFQDRFRAVEKINNICGQPCEGVRVETIACEPKCHNPKQDCELTEWTTPIECGKSCGGGQTFRERTVKQQSKNGGKPCQGALRETLQCNTQPCDPPVHCALGEWSDWGLCTEMCDGTQTRTRVEVVQARHGGRNCDASVEELRPCSRDPACPEIVDCQWSDWEEWGACSSTCGIGEKSRSRNIEVAPRLSGAKCDVQNLAESALCELENCAETKDCVLTEWSEWDACSCKCNGIKQRLRHVTQYPEDGGKICEGSLREIEPCNKDCKLDEDEKPVEKLDDNAIDCTLDNWSAWGNCSTSCGGGIFQRSRNIVSEPSPTGAPCEASLEEIQACNTQKCVEDSEDIETAIDCIVSEWEEWAACSVTCGGGLHTRSRLLEQSPNKKGKECKSIPLVQVEECGTDFCECIDCEFSPWGDWSACNCTGLRSHHRVITRHYSVCGKPCTGPKTETINCIPDCQGSKMIDCRMNEWSPWADCSVSCGGGTRARDRSIVKDAAGGGKLCNDDISEIEPCNVQSCAMSINCELTPWSEWTRCTATCDGGQQQRTRYIDQYSDGLGKLCEGDLTELRGCGEGECGVSYDCMWGEWSVWGACSESCGGGHRNRDRAIQVAPRFNGKLCESKSKSESQACNTRTCDLGCIDGSFTEWTEWGNCSKNCGKGIRHRTRDVKEQPNDCGNPLEGELQEFESCELGACSLEPIDCSFALWSDWGDCSCSCHGLQERGRQIVQYSQNGGEPCQGSLKEIIECNTLVCDQTPKKDCQLSMWSDWGVCSAPCDGGHSERHRTVVSPPANGGRSCETSLRELRGCNKESCNTERDCVWGVWLSWTECSVSCGGGTTQRFRHITTLPTGKGAPCDKKSSYETTRCADEPCGDLHYCTWDAWQSWSQCSEECGLGQKKRKRSLLITTERPSSREDIIFTGMLDDVSEISSPISSSAAFLFQGLSAFVGGVLLVTLGLLVITRQRSIRRRNSMASSSSIGNDDSFEF